MDTKYGLNPFTLAPCAIFQSFWPETQVCEGSTFIVFPNGMKLFHPLKYLKSLPPPKFSSFHWTMWAQEKFLVSVQIFSLWRKCILSCSIMSDNFSRPYPTHITYLHKIVAHFTWPIAWGFSWSFWTELIVVKEVPFWWVHLVWTFYSIMVCSNHQALPSYSPVHHS